MRRKDRASKKDSGPPRTIHDGFFKQLFSHPERAASELRAVLPAEVVRHIDWQSLEVERANIVGKRFKQHHGDLLLRAPLGRGPERGKRRAGAIYLWLLFEHQSTVDARMVLRVLEMMLAFWRDHAKRYPRARRVPAVVPVVLYHGKEPWSAATTLEEMLDVPAAVRDDLRAYLPACRLVLDDLRRTSDEELVARDVEPYVKLALMAFKHGSSKELAERLGRMRSDIRALVRSEHGIVLLQAIFEYTWHINPYVDEKTLGEHLGPEARKAMISYAEKIKQEAHARGVEQGHRHGIKHGIKQGVERGIKQGVERGIKQGVERGVEQGQRDLLLDLLARRFGPLPQTVTARVSRGKAADLRRWGLRVLDAASLDDVFRRS